MKQKLLYSVLFILGLFAFVLPVHAEPTYSLTSNVGTVEKGSKVTFTITLKNVASWNLSGVGTGATSSCKLLDDVRVGDTGTGANATKKFTVTCVATNTGLINFSLTGSISQASGTDIIKKVVNADKQVKVIPVQPKSSNNYLKELSVAGYELTPAFDKNTLEYTVSVPSTTEMVNISATRADSTASVHGTGEQAVQEGSNLLEVVVRAQNGNERVYKITVMVEDQNPIHLKIDGTTYTILKNVKNIEVPVLFEEGTTKIGDTEVPAYLNKTIGLTLVAVKDERGNITYAEYQAGKNAYKLYQPMESYELHLYLLTPKTDLAGFERKNVKVGNVQTEAFVTKNTVVVYAKNMETNEDGYYLYDGKYQSFAKYDHTMIEDLLHQNDIYLYVIIGVSVLVILLLIVLLIVLCRKPKRKAIPKRVEPEVVPPKEEIPVADTKKASKKKEAKKEEPVVEKTKEEVKTDVKPSVKEEEKKEEPKVIETPEEMEEEFYSILDDKPMKREKRK